MEEALAGNYTTQSPVATKVEAAPSPWPGEKAPTGFLVSLTECPVREGCPNHLGAKMGDVYEH